MFDIDKWQEIFSTIRKNKLRTILTMFSVFWGIFILVILLGSGNGLENGVKKQFEGDASNSIWIYQGETSMPYKGMQSGRKIQFTNEDYDFVKNYVKSGECFSGRTGISGSGVVTYKNNFGNFNISCVHPDMRYLEEVAIVEGRFLDNLDIQNKNKSVVISYIVKDELFKQKTAIGEFIKISGVPFQVIGVFKDKSDWDNRRVYIPISTAQMIFNGGNKLFNIAFTTSATSVSEAVKLETDLKAVMAKRFKYDPADKRAIFYNNNVESYARTMSLFAGIRYFVWGIGIMTILAGIVGVSNIMIVVVKERTKEIGIRKALGATPWSIINLIIMESILITSFAGFLGLSFSVWVLQALQPVFSSPDSFFQNPSADIGVAIKATILLVFAGTVAGLIPAIRAAKVRPVIALQEE